MDRTTHRCLRAAGLALLCAAVLPLVGCQEDGRRPVVSLEEAKQISARFEGQGFAPPPRTIADITAVLDRQRPDPAKAAAVRRQADAEPQAGASPADLAAFYLERGLAAAEAGRTAQRVADFESAVTYSRRAGLSTLAQSRALQQLGFAYMAAGNYAAFRRSWEERVALHNATADARGFLFNVYQIGATAAARFGQIEEAQRSLALLERLLGESATWRNVNPILRTDWQVQVLRARAAVFQETGRYAEAESSAREALSLTLERLVPAESQSASAVQLPPGTYQGVRDGTHVDLARALLDQGRLIEAEVEVRRSLLSRLERRGRYASETAGNVQFLARVLLEQGRAAEAELLADAARDIHANIGAEPSSFALNNALVLLARAKAAQDKDDEALAVWEQIERNVGGDPFMRRRFMERNVGYALLIARKQGRRAEAARLVESIAAANRAQFGERHLNAAFPRGWLGVLHASAGRPQQALPEFEAAVPILLSPSRQVADEELSGAQRDRQIQRIVEAYIATLADTRGAAAAPETFRLADAIRGQSVQRALTASSARAAAADPVLADLVRREQDARNQASAFQGILTYVLSNPDAAKEVGSTQSIREQIDQLRAARAAIREEIERRFPDYANLIDPRPATLDQAQRALAPGEALIATYVGEQRFFVWAVPASGPPAFASVPVRGREIDAMVAALRRALDPNATTLGDIPVYDVALAHRLYEIVLKPVEAGWRDAKSLLFVPHRSLGQLPLGLLVTEPAEIRREAGGALFEAYRTVPFLVRRVAVTQLPSVNALATLRALPPAPANRQAFIGFGDPWFSAQQATEARAQRAAGSLVARGAALTTRSLPLVRRNAPQTQTVDSAELGMLPRLPDTADEVRSIAAALSADPARDVILGAAANERTVKTMALNDRRIIAFATHGLVPGDLNGLTQPALALSAPAVADIDGDGLLTMDEILALKLNADWVVLSACNTATGEGAGAEAVSGLGRAFFYAGTRALLVSNWPVETSSARALTTDLFRRQAINPALSRAEAMRQAMVALIDGPGAVEDGKAVFSYAHPIFWAPFSVVGDGGGGRPGS